MSLNNFGLGIVFTASDLASSVIRGLGRSFMGLDNTAKKALDGIAKKIGVTSSVMTKSLKGMAKGLALAAVGFVGLKSAFGVTDLAAKFEFKLAGIQAISGATAVELKRLEKAALEAGIATQFSPLEAAEGLQTLAQAGFKTTKSIKTLLPILDLAAASLEQLGIEEAGGVTISALKVFPEVADDATKAVDNLVRSTARSRLEFRDLPLALGIAARGVKIFNASMQDTLIALGEVKNVIPTVERGATSVATAMELLATGKVQKKLEKLGVEVLTLDKKGFRPFLDVMADTARAFKGMSGDAERGAKLLNIFGRRGVSGLAPLLDAIAVRAAKAGGGVKGFTAAIREMRGEMNRGEVTAEGFRRTLNATFKGLMKLLQGTLDTILISVGLPFAKALAPMVETLTKSLNTLLRMFMDIPEGAKIMIAQFLILASAITLVFGTVTALFAMKGVFIALAAAAALIAKPFFAILAVIALVAGAAMLLKAAWDANVGGMRDSLLPILEKVTMFFKGLFQAITTGKITGALAKTLGDPKNSGILDFITGFTKAFAIIKAIAVGILGAYKSVFGEIATAMGPVFGEFATMVQLIGGQFLLLGKIVGKTFGLDFGKGGIKSFTTLASAFTKVFLFPVVKGLKVLLFTFRMVLAMINGILTVVNFIQAPFIGIATVIGSAFQAVFTLLTGNFGEFFKLITTGINAMITALNFVITTAQKVAFRVAPNAKIANSAVDALQRLKLKKLSTVQVAFGLGGSTEVVKALKNESAAKPKAESGVSSGISSGSLFGSSDSSTGSVPNSVPSSTRNKGEALSALDLRNVIEAAGLAGARRSDGRPIVVQSEISIDGEVLASVQAQRRRDHRASRGLTAPSLRDE